MNNTLRIILRFIILVSVQVLVLNNIRLGGFLNPYLYVLFIITLPFVIPGWQLLLLGFLTGFLIDAFSNAGGIHAAATVLMAFIRPGLIKMYFRKETFEPSSYPSIKTMGFQYFLGYILVMVLIHHSVLFFLELFKFAEIGFTLLRILLSSALTILLIITVQYLFLNKK